MNWEYVHSYEPFKLNKALYKIIMLLYYFQCFCVTYSSLEYYCDFVKIIFIGVGNIHASHVS